MAKQPHRATTMSLLIVLATCSLPLRAQREDPIALTGQVISHEEGPMEGVLVSARGERSNVTTTVVTDERGQYRFPAARLKPNKYRVSIRAVGYEIGNRGSDPLIPNIKDGTAADKHTLPLSLPIDIRAGKAARLDLTLTVAPDLASQLSKGEWLNSFPGAAAMSDVQREEVKRCGYCHSLERVVKSRYDANGFVDVIRRMTNYVDNGTSPSHILMWPKGKDVRAHALPQNIAVLQRRAQYLSSINLSAGSDWRYALKTFQRPKGEATKVIYTEYDLPRPETQPHDAIVDSSGMVWYSDFGGLFLGRLDPRTGAVKEWPIPEMRQGYPPAGSLSVNVDEDDNVWVGSLFQAAVYRFNRKTEKFSSWADPKEYNNEDSRNSMTAPQHSHVDGKVWFGNAQDNAVIHRIDLATDQVETFKPFTVESIRRREHTLYGIASDSKNNLYFADYVGSGIGFINAKTGAITLYPTTTPRAWPRRMSVDSQDRLWFAENAVNKLAVFDPATKRIQEWEMSTPWTDPYDVMLDRNGEAWTAGMVTDRVVRLNPKTGKMVEYLLPRPTQTRRVFVDNHAPKVAFWVGSNLGASIVKLEPLP